MIRTLIMYVICKYGILWCLCLIANIYRFNNLEKQLDMQFSDNDAFLGWSLGTFKVNNLK
jgi:hypothetical protein